MTGTAPNSGAESIQLRAAASFFGAPVADIEDLKPGMIAAVGVYCDHFSGGQPGGRFGARQLRYLSTLTGPPEQSSVVDLGDFNVFPLEPKRALESLSEQSRRLVSTGAKVFAIGGDYSVTPAIVRGIARGVGNEPLAIVRLSRRLDLLQGSSKSIGEPRRDSATTELAKILPNGLSAIALMGCRGRVSGEESELASAAIVVPVSRVVAEPAACVREVADSLARVAGRLYLSVDVDVMAPRFGARAMPGAYGGLSLAELGLVLAEFEGMAFIGAELTGHLPDLDLPGRAMTSQIASVASSILRCLAPEASTCR